MSQGNLTLGQMIDSGPNQSYKLNNGATLFLDEFKMQERVSFLDYIMGGCEINVHVAIDFTLSNGDPRDPRSLHYINPRRQTNDYLEAIHSVMSILENYDTHKSFPTYGFGGIVPDSKTVSHCFALNGNIYQPECVGTPGVAATYMSAIQKVQLYGGTHFSSILSLINGVAHQ